MRSCFFLALAVGLDAQPAADFAAKADAHVSAYAQQNRYMGSVLVAQGGKVLLSKGYGMANLEHEVANRPNTKFRIGSITKQFTATAILRCRSGAS